MVQSAIFQKCDTSGKDRTLFPSNFSPVYLGGDGKEYRKSILKCMSVCFTGRGKRWGAKFLEASFKSNLQSSVVEGFVLASLFWHWVCWHVITPYLYAWLSKALQSQNFCCKGVGGEPNWKPQNHSPLTHPQKPKPARWSCQEFNPRFWACRSYACNLFGKWACTWLVKCCLPRVALIFE